MENNKELPAEGSSRFVQHTEGRTTHSWSRAGFPGRPKTPPCPKGYPPSAARCETPSLSLQRRYRSLTLVCAFSCTSPWQPPSSQLGLPPAGNRVRRARRTPRCKSHVSACTGSELTPRLLCWCRDPQGCHGALLLAGGPGLHKELAAFPCRYGASCALCWSRRMDTRPCHWVLNVVL